MKTFLNKKSKENQKNKIITNASKPFLYTVSVIFGIYCITLIFPFVWIFINSFKDKNDFILNPTAFTMSIKYITNYATIMEDFDLVSMFINTILMSVIIPTVSIFVTACVAYAVSKYPYKIGKIIFLFAMLDVYVTVSGTLPTTYKMMYNLNLMDSLFGIIVMGSGGLNFNFLILFGIFKSLSKSYKEAAEIDGANPWIICFKIYMPQALGTLLAMWILAFIAQWNNYQTPYLFWPSHQTLATGLKNLSDNISKGEYMLDYPRLFAAMVITIIPVFVIYALFQKPITKIDMSGGIKG